jgi:hypothetical protein
MLEFPCLDAQAPQLGSESRGWNSKDSGSLSLIALCPLQSFPNQSSFTLPELCLEKTRGKNFHAPSFTKRSLSRNHSTDPAMSLD